MDVSTYQPIRWLYCACCDSRRWSKQFLKGRKDEEGSITPQLLLIFQEMMSWTRNASIYIKCSLDKRNINRVTTYHVIIFWAFFLFLPPFRPFWGSEYIFRDHYFGKAFKRTGPDVPKNDWNTIPGRKFFRLFTTNPSTRPSSQHWLKAFRIMSISASDWPIKFWHALKNAG